MFIDKLTRFIVSHHWFLLPASLYNWGGHSTGAPVIRFGISMKKVDLIVHRIGRFGLLAYGGVDDLLNTGPLAILVPVVDSKRILFSAS